MMALYMTKEYENSHGPEHPHEPSTEAGGNIDQRTQRFVDDIHERRDATLHFTEELMNRAYETWQSKAIAIYVYTAVRRHALNRDPYDDRFGGIYGDTLRDEFEAITDMAAQDTADYWLARHPNSKAAQQVLAWGVLAPPSTHLEFLQEIWRTASDIVSLEES
jgi:hypothetical protein